MITLAEVLTSDGQMTVTRDAPTGEPRLDSASAAIAGDGRAYGPEYWAHHPVRGAQRGSIGPPD